MGWHVLMRYKLHAVAVREIVSECFMSVGASTFKNAEVVGHVPFVRAAVTPKRFSIFKDQNGMKPDSASIIESIIETVDDGEIFGGFVVGVVNVDGATLALEKVLVEVL